jgi:hypothetical protein
MSRTELRGVMLTLSNQAKNRKFTPAAFWQNNTAAREMTQICDVNSFFLPRQRGSLRHEHVGLSLYFEGFISDKENN